MAKTATQKIRLSTKERLNLFTDMSTMLTAGIPILEVIESLNEDSKGNTKKVLNRLRTTLNNGIPISRAMAQMPKAFDPVSVNLIRSAEAGGTLETTLKDIVDSQKREMAFSSQLRTTMIYPLFVMAIFSGIVVLMLTFVIPRVSEVFSSMNIHEPWVTKVMIKASKFFLRDWIEVIVGLVLVVIASVVFAKANKRLIVRTVLRLPMLKKLGINIDLARFTRSFGLLMRAGVPINDALNLSQRVVQKKQIINVITQMRADVEAGKPLSNSMHKPGSVIPPIMWRSIKTAEDSGTFDQTLQNLTDHFDSQVAESLKILSSLVEPVLIVVVGVLVGLLMISIIAPIYNMISQINSNPS
jgi:type IV pilus assembly protein PilC